MVLLLLLEPNTNTLYSYWIYLSGYPFNVFPCHAAWDAYNVHQSDASHALMCCPGLFNPMSCMPSRATAVCPNVIRFCIGLFCFRHLFSWFCTWSFTWSLTWSLIWSLAWFLAWSFTWSFVWSFSWFFTWFPIIITYQTYPIYKFCILVLRLGPSCHTLVLYVGSSPWFCILVLYLGSSMLILGSLLGSCLVPHLGSSSGSLSWLFGFPTMPRLFLLPASNGHLQSRSSLFAVAIVPVILPTRLIPSISLSSLFIFIPRLIQL